MKMTFSEKIELQLQKFRVKAPSYSKHLHHIYADYVELISLFANDCFVTADGVIDRLRDDGFKIKEKDVETLEIGSNVAENEDESEKWINDVFAVLENRANLYGSDYPFNYFNNRIIRLNQFDFKHKLYISLLLSSNLNLFDKVSSELTSEFETISYHTLKNFLPKHSIVKQFGKNSDYAGNAKSKIRALAKDMSLDVDEYEISNVSDRNNQERGLDVVGWIPFSDNCGNQLTILGQCACGKDWPSKHHDTKRYVHYLLWYRHRPLHAIFIPYSMINYGINKFFASDEVENETILFERKRILQYFGEEDVFNTLNSKLLVEKCLIYQEDLV